MLSRLIESGAGATARRQWLPSGLIAVAAHAVIVAGAALATLEPTRRRCPLRAPTDREGRAHPPPAYPELLRAAGIEGRVVLQVVIDTLGRAEPAARVFESSNPGFDGAALACVRGARFRPGRVGGRAVRVLIRLPIAFTLRGVR